MGLDLGPLASLDLNGSGVGRGVLDLGLEPEGAPVEVDMVEQARRKRQPYRTRKEPEGLDETTTLEKRLGTRGNRAVPPFIL